MSEGMGEEMLDVEFEDEKEGKEKSSKPVPGSVEWHDFVMSLLTVDEKDGKDRPKCDGMRRVMHQLFDIVSSRSTNFQVLESGETLVNWEVEYLPRKEMVMGPDFALSTVTVSALASAGAQNTDRPFNKYLAAMADTRAEARCYKKVLMLRCLASEEVEPEEDETGAATGAQYKGAEIMMGRLKIDKEKFLKHHRKDIAPSAKGPKLSLDKLNKEAMSNVMNLLNRYQSNNELEVPKEIKVG